MENITREIERALQAGLYYVALQCALTLPDICGALEATDGIARKRQFLKWYTAWLEPTYPDITGEDLYSLRCGLVHQGRLGHPNSQYSRILFGIPSQQNNILHDCISEITGGETVLMLNVVVFCRDVMDAVSRWYTAKHQDTNVQANLPRLVQYYEQGIPPHFVGVPLIG